MGNSFVPIIGALMITAEMRNMMLREQASRDIENIIKELRELRQEIEQLKTQLVKK